MKHRSVGVGALLAAIATLLPANGASAATGDASVLVGGGGPGRGAALNLSIAAWDLAATPDTLYVLDPLDPEASFGSTPRPVVRAIDLVTGNAEVIAEWTDGTLTSMGNIAADARSGAVYITDPIRHRVVVVRDGETSVFAGGGDLAVDNPAVAVPATMANLSSPTGVGVDGEGNVYISEPGDSRIRKVTTDGKIHTVAAARGLGVPFVDDVVNDRIEQDGLRVHFPRQLAVDHQDRLLIVDTDPDSGESRILRLDLDGTLSQLDAEGGITDARDIAVTAAGEILVLELVDHEFGVTNRLVHLEDDGSVMGIATFGGDAQDDPWPVTLVAGVGTTFLGSQFLAGVFTADPATTRIAGNGLVMSGGDGGLAADAQLIRPMEVETDAGGNVYIREENTDAIHRVGCDGVIQKIAEDVAELPAMAGGGPGELFVIDRASSSLVRIRGTEHTVVATSPELSFATALARAPDGSFFFAGAGSLYRLGVDGVVTAITEDGALPGIWGMTVGPDGHVWLTSPDCCLVTSDERVNTVMRVDPDTGEVVIEMEEGSSSTLVVGSTDPQISVPTDVDFDSQGNLYVSDQFSNRVVRRSPDGLVTEVKGAARKYPESITIDSADNLFVADATLPWWPDEAAIDDAVRMVEGGGRAAACVPIPLISTSLTYTGDTQGRGEQVHLAAVLFDADGAPIEGKEILFEINGESFVAVTDATGNGQVDATVPDHGRSQSVVVTFAGDEGFEASETAATITWGRAKGEAHE